MSAKPGTLELRTVSCSRSDLAPVHAASAAFTPGRFHLLLGAADSGHDLLLRVLGLLEVPDAGDVLLDGVPTRVLAQEVRADIRTRRFGYVFAAPFLLTSFTVIENVAMPLFKISQVGPEEARQRTEKLLAFAGVGEVVESAGSELGLPAQYRVAVARGLINDPSVLFVENLDGALAGGDLNSFASLLRRIPVELGVTVIATASRGFIVESGDRVLEIAGGGVARDSGLIVEPRS
jgi:lipoprotein-releasing system ATP-binding protein